MQSDKAPAGQGNSYVAFIAPDGLVDGADTGREQSFTITFSELRETTFLGSAEVTVPESFTNLAFDPGEIAAAAGKSWGGQLVGQVLSLWALDAESYLRCGESVSVTFAATTPAAGNRGAYGFATAAWTDAAAGFDGVGTTVNNMATGYRDPVVVVGLPIRNAAQLAAINATAASLGDHYVQVRDIDLSGYSEGAGWLPLGSHSSFTGSYNGNGHTLSNLTIRRDGSTNIGLFGRTGSGSRIMNVILDNVDVTGTIQTGGLVGYSESTVTLCQVSGTVVGRDDTGGLIGLNFNNLISRCRSDASVSGGYNIGGIVGANGRHWTRDSTIVNSHATGSVTGTDTHSYSGGLVGANFGHIQYCHALGDVDGKQQVGGLAGRNSRVILDCFASGRVSGDYHVGGFVGHTYSNFIYATYATGAVGDGSRVGGFAGRNRETGIYNSYSAGPVAGDAEVGGFAGINSSGSFNNCHWDTETSGQTGSAGATGRTTGQMQTLATFANWAIEEYDPSAPPGARWHLRSGLDYPRLFWEHPLYEPFPASDPLRHHTLVYTAGTGGTVDGLAEVVRIVTRGRDGAPVAAQPAPGNRFAGWSDGVTTATRTDTHVTADVTATAQFVPKRVPTIVWPAPETIVYGTALSDTQLDAEADTPGQFIYDPPADTMLPVGTHTLQVVFAPDDEANWTDADATVQLTVGKASLAVTAADKTRPYGQENPALGWTAAGFVNGEDVSTLAGEPELACAATPASPVADGPYPITLAPGTLTADNYTFDFADGALTVAPAVLTATAGDAMRLFGDPNPQFAVALTGFVIGEDESLLATLPTAACTADETSPAGNYDIVPADGAAANYAFAYVNGNLTVLAGGRFTLQTVPGDGGAPADLEFGEAETADSGIDAWDMEATPDQCARLILASGQALARDFRPVATGDGITRWRLDIPDMALRGTLNLSWNVAAADPARALWLQELDDHECPVGFPLDMKAGNELSGATPGTVYEIIYGALREFAIPLSFGWNAVGTPLLTTDSFVQVCATAGAAVALPAWRWLGGGFEPSPDDEPFLPKTGYLVRSDADVATLTVTGLPPNPILSAPTGWQLASPVETTPLDGDRSGTTPAWRWDAERQVYRSKNRLHPGRAYWRHAGQAATAGEPDAGEVLRSTRGRESEPDVPLGDLDALVAGNTAFALDLYHQWRKEDGNLFLSPHSLSVALGMTYDGARNRTASEMAAVLRFTVPDDRLHAAFNALDLELASRGEGEVGTDGEPFRLKIVNQLWGERTYSFLDGFLDALAEHYGAGLRLMDFIGAPEPARLAINDWVAYQTEQRIRDLLPEGSINNLARLVLTNAIYFNAAWQSPFDVADTSPRPFTRLDGGQIHVPTMRQRANFRAVEGGNFQAIELPYDGGELSLLILLPEVGAFTDFERALDPATIQTVLDGLGVRDVDLVLPVFEYSSRASVKPFLSRLGMVDAFTEAADFSGMDGTLDLLLADIVHQAFVKVDEKGTEAAAATGVVVGVTSHPEFIEVHADRPFLFLIRDHDTDAILFMGRMLDPTL